MKRFLMLIVLICGGLIGCDGGSKTPPAPRATLEDDSKEARIQAAREAAGKFGTPRGGTAK